MTKIEELKTAVINGKRKIVKEVVPELIESGVAPEVLLKEALIPAMAMVGEKFKKNEIFVPEMLVSARAMKQAMSLLEPELIAAGIKPEFTAMIGTVEGDLHDIGKNLVSTMWKSCGFEVIDLGVNVSPDSFLEAIETHQPHLVGLSALLTTTMPAMKATITKIRDAGHTDIKIVIGGAPVTQNFADEIGADGYAPDAASAVDTAKTVVGAPA